MFGTKAKVCLDLSYLVFITFMTASVAHTGIFTSSYYPKTYKAATSLGLVSVILACIYKILDALSPVVSFCKKLSLNAFGLVVLPVLSTLCAALDLILYCVEYNDFPNAVWFSLTLIGVIFSIVATISSIVYFRRPVKKGLLN